MKTFDITLWKSKVTPWPENHRQQYFTGHRTDLVFDLIMNYPATIGLTLQRINICANDGRDFSVRYYTGIGLAWQFKFSYSHDYYDGDLYALNIGPIAINWGR